MNQILFQEMHFTRPNGENYDHGRFKLLHSVLQRKMGVSTTLAIIVHYHMRRKYL
jgi:regulator of sirC expression with transglutaminase-like and TPR domain